MSLDDCQAAYLKISERIFNPKRNKLNAVGRAKDFLLADGKFDYREVEDAIKDVLQQDCGLPEATLLQDPDTQSKV